MPIKNKKSNNNKSPLNVLIVAVCVLVVGVLGYTVLKNNTNLFSNDSAQAEEKAKPQELAFTPAEKAAADAERQGSMNLIFSNQGGVDLLACRFESRANRYWYLRIHSRKNIDAKRTIKAINVNRSVVLKSFDVARSGSYGRDDIYYGTTKSGYAKILIGQTGAYRVLKFNSLVVCS